MASTGSEIKDLVTTVENGFKAGRKDPHTRTQEIRDILFGRYDYTAELSQYLNQKIGVAADVLRVYKDQMVAALRTDMRLHLEPVGSLKRQETAADRVEVMEANQLMRINADGLLVEDINYYLTVGLYWAGWLELEQYVAPEQAKGESNKDFADRAKRERDGFFGWSLRTLNPGSTAWLEGDNRTPTTAVLHYRKPVIDLLCRYGASYNVRRDDPSHALKVFNDHFGSLRGDLDRSEWDERSLFTSDIEIVVCDDGARISHYADLSVVFNDKRRGKGTEDKDRYYGMGDTDFDNPFGQCSLLLAEGVYNPYEEPAYRREGLLMAAINIEHAKSRIKSHWASEAAEPTFTYEKLPDTPGADDGEQIVMQPIINAEGRPILARTKGEIMQVTREIDKTVEKLYGVLSDETALAAMRSYLFDPDKSNKDTAASITLAQIDEAAKMLASAQSSKARMFSRALDMIRHSQVNKQNSHRKKGEPSQRSDQGYTFITTGKETKVKGRAIKNGEPIEVTPQDLDQDYVRTLEPFDNSVAAMEARGQRGQRRWAAGSILYDEYLEEEGIENISEFKKKKFKEQMFQLKAPEYASQMVLRVAQYSSAVSGQPVEEILMGLPEDVVPRIVGAGGPPQAGGSAGVQRFGSPVQNQPAQMGSTSVG